MSLNRAGIKNVVNNAPAMILEINFSLRDAFFQRIHNIQ